ELSKEISDEEKIKFQKLTPFDGSDMGIYNKSMDFVWDDPELLNVALTGPYGSGKSSIIRTYIKSRKKENVLYVSLAHFEEYKYENPKLKKEIDNESYYTESSLEGKIINQFVHQIPKNQIPRTNFNILEKTPFKKV